MKVLLKGTPASPGKAEGQAKIIASPDQMSKMKKGDILIAPFTTPLLTPAILKASAIITETGGQLCHAAIVARESGIPCIVSVKDAIAILEEFEGQNISLDGKRGVVYAS